jgi:hypothetical protein
MSTKTEVHQEGTAMELSLSRKLIRDLEDSGEVLSPAVALSLDKIKKFYKKQIRNGLL